MGLVHLSSQTASNSSSLSFTSGIDSTYDDYEFHFVNIHPSWDNVWFEFQVNAVGQTGFNETLQSNGFGHINREDGTYNNFFYDTINSVANQGIYQKITYRQGFDNDQSSSGILRLHAPSSTTFVKHFECRTSSVHYGDVAVDMFMSGYINTTSAIDEINFKFDTGTIGDGTIHMYGVE